MTDPLCRRCGHDQAAHQHYRPGTNCTHCTCRRYTKKRRWFR